MIRATVLLTVCLLAFGCSDDDTTNSSSVEQSQATEANSSSVELSQVAEADQPIVMRPHPDGTVWVGEREGRVRQLDLGSDMLGDPILDLSDAVTTDSERGLLGMAFDPEGTRLYVHYSGPDGEGRLESFAFEPEGIDIDTRAIHLTVDQPFANHNGGDLHFGPDGYLYLALGDGGSGGDPEGNGQNTETLLGAILRIGVDGSDGYEIPPDNPFVDGGGRPEIYVYGVRNPWRIDIDEPTGDLWIADVGQGEIEEINRLGEDVGFGLGANLGWALREGSEEFSGDEPDGHVTPLFEYGHGPGCSVTGGYVYRGSAIAGLSGTFVYGDYCEGVLRTVGPDGTARSLDISVDERDLISFGVDADGELYVLTASGPILAIVPDP